MILRCVLDLIGLNRSVVESDAYDLFDMVCAMWFWLAYGE